jgi:hypothetical protein
VSRGAHPRICYASLLGRADKRDDNDRRARSSLTSKPIAGLPLIRPVKPSQCACSGIPVKSHPSATIFAAKDDPSDGAETGGAEPRIAEQSRSWRAASGRLCTVLEAPAFVAGLDDVAVVCHKHRGGHFGVAEHRVLQFFGRVVYHLTITDPHHFLFGHRLRSARGSAYVIVALPDGRRRLVRIVSTNLAEAPTMPGPDIPSLPRISARTLMQHLSTNLRLLDEKVIRDGTPTEPANRPE